LTHATADVDLGPDGPQRRFAGERPLERRIQPKSRSLIDVGRRPGRRDFLADRRRRGRDHRRRE